MTAAAPATLLARLGADAALTLADGARAFAAFHGVAEGGLEQRLEQWAEGADDLAGLTGRLAHLRLEEADPGQLPQVAETGAGSAAALAILWIEVARRAGWAAEALDFPGAVPVRLTAADGSRVIVDPACGGLQLDPAALRALVKAGDGADAELRPELFVPMSNRALLLRLQAEIRGAALHGGRIALAVTVVDGMLAFAPDQVPLWREAGMMNLRLERMAAAIAALEQFAARTANCAARRRTQQLLHELRGRLP